jgi:hypothetical protein
MLRIASLHSVSLVASSSSRWSIPPQKPVPLRGTSAPLALRLTRLLLLVPRRQKSRQCSVAGPKSLAGTGCGEIPACKLLLPSSAAPPQVGPHALAAAVCKSSSPKTRPTNPRLGVRPGPASPWLSSETQTPSPLLRGPSRPHSASVGVENQGAWSAVCARNPNPGSITKLRASFRCSSFHEPPNPRPLIKTASGIVPMQLALLKRPNPGRVVRSTRLKKQKDISSAAAGLTRAKSKDTNPLE